MVERRGGGRRRRSVAGNLGTDASPSACRCLRDYRQRESSVVSSLPVVASLASLPEATEQRGTVVIRSVRTGGVSVENRRLKAILPEPPPAGEEQTIRGAYRYDPMQDVADGTKAAIRIGRADKSAGPSAWIKKLPAGVVVSDRRNDATRGHVRCRELGVQQSSADDSVGRFAGRLRRRRADRMADVRQAGCRFALVVGGFRKLTSTICGYPRPPQESVRDRAVDDNGAGARSRRLARCRDAAARSAGARAELDRVAAAGLQERRLRRGTAVRSCRMGWTSRCVDSLGRNARRIAIRESRVDAVACGRHISACGRCRLLERETGASPIMLPAWRCWASSARPSCFCQASMCRSRSRELFGIVFCLTLRWIRRDSTTMQWPIPDGEKAANPNPGSTVAMDIRIGSLLLAALLMPLASGTASAADPPSQTEKSRDIGREEQAADAKPLSDGLRENNARQIGFPRFAAGVPRVRAGRCQAQAGRRQGLRARSVLSRVVSSRGRARRQTAGVADPRRPRTEAN